MSMKWFVMFRFVVVLSLILGGFLAITMTSCRAQRTIAADGTTIVVNSAAQVGDTVHCSFKLHETYQGRAYKKQ